MFTELTHRVRQALTQTVNVRTALHRWDKVDVSFRSAVHRLPGSHSSAQSTASVSPAKMPDNGFSGSVGKPFTASAR
ncbi:hypothetical protein ACLK19_20195 [Escherichia coli]